ncbi:hypothetical protein HMPREF6745_0761 [Prevotella sp. oral taxon 472 str. F0295]|nr:hypothetical protein HMPREF6745_0761 [Prevotella sp. oral taxon 472 str. F0295]
MFQLNWNLVPAYVGQGSSWYKINPFIIKGVLNPYQLLLER